jgi:hypothetical protein
MIVCTTQSAHDKIWLRKKSVPIFPHGRNTMPWWRVASLCGWKTARDAERSASRAGAARFASGPATKIGKKSKKVIQDNNLNIEETIKY